VPIFIKLEHTLEEVNTILAALAKRPFEEVADLIVKIQAAGKSAIDDAQAPVQSADSAVES
jgi:hypothetical protein